MSENLPAIPQTTVALLRTHDLAGLESLVLDAVAHEERVATAYVALALIHESGEFKVDHRSFKAYAQTRFGISESFAYRWLAMGQAVLLGEFPTSQRALEEGKKDQTSRAGVTGKKRFRKGKSGPPCPHCNGSGIAPTVEAKSTVKSPRRMDQRAEPSGNCKHPSYRRVGSQCGDCGAIVGK